MKLSFIHSHTLSPGNGYLVQLQMAELHRSFPVMYGDLSTRLHLTRSNYAVTDVYKPGTLFRNLIPILWRYAVLNLEHC